MSHHGDRPYDGPSFKELLDMQGSSFKELLDTSQEQRLGPTGQFPDGKLTPQDEGEIRLAIGVKDGKVVFDLGKPVAWIGFTPKQAREVALSLFDKAAEIEGVGMVKGRG